MTSNNPSIQQPINPSTTIFAFAYGRVSSQAVGGVSRQEQSVEIQDHEFREYLRFADIPPAAFGENFERIYLERHTGAFAFGDIRKRPEGARLWLALETTRLLNPHAAIHLIFTKVDRIGRAWLDTQIMMRDLRALKIRVHVIMLGGKSFDCETLIGQKIVSDLAWLSEMEVIGIQARINEAKTFARRRHEQLGGACPPYGSDAIPTGETRINKGGKAITVRILQDNPAEQQWIAHMVRLKESGWGYGRIATELNRLGVPTKRGAGEVMNLRAPGRTNGRPNVHQKFTKGQWQCGNVEGVIKRHYVERARTATAEQLAA